MRMVAALMDVAMLEFVGVGLAYPDYLSGEVQSLASKRMIEVYRHLIGVYSRDTALKRIAVLVPAEV
jgi:hypothetical protein